MRILILHSSSDLYGASKILLTTIKFLKVSHTPIVVLSEEGELSTALRAEGIEVVIIRLGILRRKYMSLWGLFNRAVVFNRAKASLTKLIQEKEIDLVYSNTIGVLVGAFAAKKAKVRHIWHVHEIVQSPKVFVKFIGWCLNNYSESVIVVSDEVNKSWRGYVSNEKLITIHNGIDYGPFTEKKSSLRKELSISNDSIIIGMIARVHPWKGQKYFLEIANKLLKENPEIIFVMVGDAFPGYEYLYKELKDFIRENKIEDNIFDLGYRRDIPEIMRGLDVFVLPSILPDPLPTVILEAMASQIPVIATKHGGALEMVIENETGVLIPWDDSSTASDLITTIIKDKVGRERFGINGRKRVIECFSLGEFERKFLSLIEK